MVVLRSTTVVQVMHDVWGTGTLTSCRGNMTFKYTERHDIEQCMRLIYCIVDNTGHIDKIEAKSCLNKIFCHSPCHLPKSITDVILM